MIPDMEAAVSQFVYHCSRSVSLYNKAIDVAGKTNLADIFRALKKRRLKLLRSVGQGRIQRARNKASVQIDNLAELLTEIQSNEQQLIKYSSKVLKNSRLNSDGWRGFLKSALSEIRSSIHWLDVISPYYVKTG